MSDAEQQTPVQQDENQLIAERRAKLAAWRKTGKAFPNDFQRENTALKLLEGYGDKSTEELEGLPVEVKVEHPFKIMDKEHPSPFNMDAWKKLYSNEKDAEGKADYRAAVKQFWPLFDPAGWSIFVGRYKFNAENGAGFMVSGGDYLWWGSW